MMNTTTLDVLTTLGTMDFATRLAGARKTAGLTQQVLADRVGIHVSQLRRYEAGTNQPTLDVLRAIAVALSVTTDSLVFGDTPPRPPTQRQLIRNPTPTTCNENATWTRTDGTPGGGITSTTTSTNTVQVPTNLAPGTHTFTAHAFDQAHNTSTQSTFNFTVAG